ncbi:DUF1501 domain-containing protein [Salinispirillum sp. LH 10-3-1]|uniref:DUF1501 domain-containing protein n=1 Tax=Salinispirillum sp. LH 10-3-1 TaxID=2952525 RepID=A0AB38YEG3_9GAMM
MNRRSFLRSLALAPVLPSALSLSMLSNRAQAAGLNYQAVNFSAPAVMPQVINIFLYGGASELAGNLTNIGDINLHSENSYTGAFGGGILNQRDGNTDPFNGGQPQITPHGFWAGAGGTYMEDMLASGDLSVYRTIHRRKNGTRSHREAIFINQKGALDVENSPGLGTRLALMLHTHRNALAGSGCVLADGRSIGSFDDGLLGLPLPFVSFEGQTTAYAQDPAMATPMPLRDLSLNANLDNPYSRLGGITGNDVVNSRIDQLVADLSGQADRFNKARTGFTAREAMAALVGDLQDARSAELPLVADGDPDRDNATGRLIYPNNGFANQIRAAVTLAIHNPSTLYASVGTPGLGGWDDHNNAVDRYRGRFAQLMQALRVAAKHIRLMHNRNIASGAQRRTDNIIINVWGDFGRLVNLNNSRGWDHANNQNLYTIGGAGVRPSGASALGKVVGTTERVGRTKTNNQYTQPTNDSYEAEAMSIAASMYGYFGAQNPQVMTADPVFNPDGDVPLDEQLAGKSPLF